MCFVLFCFLQETQHGMIKETQELQRILDPILSSASHCASLGQFLNHSRLLFSIVKYNCLPIIGLLREY